MSISLGGNVVVRNGNSLDFCWQQAVQSLLPVCDRVLVCDGESTDGTQEEIRAWCDREPKLVMCVYPWVEYTNQWDFFFTWLQYARQHTPCDYHFQLDADEILSERSYQEIASIKRRNPSGPFSVVVRRHNFWGDHKHLIPHGVCLAHDVIRIAPTNIPLASDGYHPEGEHAASIAEGSGIEIFHYGFIRKREAFFEKERLLQKWFFGGYDPRLEAAEKYDGNWMLMPHISGWENALLPYDGPHPEVIRPWLKQRGMEP